MYPRTLFYLLSPIFYSSMKGSGALWAQVSETLAVVLSLLTWSIPWVTGRLEEAQSGFRVGVKGYRDKGYKGYKVYKGLGLGFRV